MDLPATHRVSFYLDVRYGNSAAILEAISDLLHGELPSYLTPNGVQLESAFSDETLNVESIDS